MIAECGRLSLVLLRWDFTGEQAARDVDSVGRAMYFQRVD
jgi:hypothetical protein